MHCKKVNHIYQDVAEDYFEGVGYNYLPWVL